VFTVEKQIEMFGMSVDDIRTSYLESMTAKFWQVNADLEMVVMSILSDAQELAAMGDKESVRKQLNIAKYILSEMMETKWTHQEQTNTRKL
jgi:hypothetical protein